MKKKVLSIILALSMVFSMVCVGVNARTTDLARGEASTSVSNGDISVDCDAAWTDGTFSKALVSIHVMPTSSGTNVKNLKFEIPAPAGQIRLMVETIEGTGEIEKPTDSSKPFTWSIDTLGNRADLSFYVSTPVRDNGLTVLDKGEYDVFNGSIKISYNESTTLELATPTLSVQRYTIIYQGDTSPNPEFVQPPLTGGDGKPEEAVPGQKVKVLGIDKTLVDNDNQTNDLIFAGWTETNSGKIYQPGDTFIMPEHDVNFLPILRTIGTLEKKAVATEAPEAKWMQLGEISSWFYITSGNKLSIKYDAGEYSTTGALDADVANALISLHNAGKINLATLTELDVQGQISSIGASKTDISAIETYFMTPLLNNGLNHFEKMDFSKVTLEGNSTADKIFFTLSPSYIDDAGSMLPDTSHDENSLKEVIMPGDLVAFANRAGAFTNFKALERVEFTKGFDNSTQGGMNYAFYNCSALETVIFSADNEIANYNSPNATTSTFEGCTNLTTIENFDEVLTDLKFATIGHGTFKDCTSLRSIEIPACITNIWSRAFAGVTEITVTIYGKNTAISDQPTAGEYVFANVSTVTIRAYGDSKAAAYATAAGSNRIFESLGDTAPTASVERAPIARAATQTSPRGTEANSDVYGEVEVGGTIDYTLTYKAMHADTTSDIFTMGLLTIADVIPDGLTLNSDSVIVTEYPVVGGTYDPEHPDDSARARGQLVKQNGQSYKYDESTRELSVCYAGLSSNAYLTVSFSCTVEDIAPLDFKSFHNSATITEQNIVKTSNVTYHYVNATNEERNHYNILYKYMGNVPSTVSALPVDSNDYAQGASVDIAALPTADGCKIDAWTLYNTKTGEIIDPNAQAGTGSNARTAGTSSANILMPDADVLAVATFATSSYSPRAGQDMVTVTYEYDSSAPANASALPQQEVVTAGTAITVAPNATSSSSNYRFDGWTLNGEELTAGEPLTVNNDIVIRGTWSQLYSVTYTFDETAPTGATLPTPVTKYYAAGEQVVPEELSDVGDTMFVGWERDGVISKEFTMPEANVVLVARWNETVKEPETYTVRYVAVQGSNTIVYKEMSNVTSHTLAKELVADHTTEGTLAYGVPEIKGKVFAGWYKSEDTANSRTESGAFAKDESLNLKDLADTNYVVTLYAGFVDEGNLTKAKDDSNQYKKGENLTGFALEGVQIRSTDVDDDGKVGEERNKVKDGLRFVTVYSNEMLEQLGKLKSPAVTYGYALAVDGTKWIKDDATDFICADGVTGVDCTREGDYNHRFFEDAGYRLSTVVIKYDTDLDNYVANILKDVYARPYVSYTDANGYSRTAYDTYTSSNGNAFHGACFTSLDNAAKGIEALAKNQ